MLEDKSKRVSPPAETEAKIGEATVVINYSKPSVKERDIWGELVPYDKVWRTGANEATTFEVDKEITVEGKSLKAGKYALFTIPGKEEWTLIFNKEYDQWGSNDYNVEEDELRVKVKPTTGDFTEQMTFDISDNGKVDLRWEELVVSFILK
ncbi:MAG: DUF2911 domain-containing protein [Bacteroidota bacterium]